VRASRGRRVEGASGCPTIRSRVVSCAGVERVIAAAAESTPDDHIVTGPDRRLPESGSGRVDGVGGCPAIRSGIVSPAGVKVVRSAGLTTPDDHFTARPDGAVVGPGTGRIGCVGGGPAIRAGIVSSASV
jgi:hypothetical protein